MRSVDDVDDVDDVITEKVLHGTVQEWMRVADIIAPQSLGECMAEGWLEAMRPCPFIRCRHHMLWYHVRRSPASKKSERLFMPWIKGKTDEDVLEEIWNMPYSCVFDCLYDGIGYCGEPEGRQYSFEAIGRIFGVTRQAIDICIDRAYDTIARARIEGGVYESFLQYGDIWNELEIEASATCDSAAPGYRSTTPNAVGAAWD